MQNVKTYEIKENNNVTTARETETKEKTNCHEIKENTTNTNRKTRTWANWPAIAHEEVGHALVTKGNSFFHNAREYYFKKDADPKTNKTLMDEFLEVYKNRPDPINVCGIRINHALALYLAVKMLQPTLVVESGVNAGVSTYFIRAASNTTRIFAIDPEVNPICGQGKRWIDTNNKTKYYTGSTFVDLLDIDWTAMITKGQVDVEKTLIFIDDHLHAFRRVVSMMKYGMRHFVIEDNYKYGEGSSFADQRSTPKQYFYAGHFATEGHYLFNNLITYAEFPPIVPPIMAKAYAEPRKKAGGFMVASDDNTDIVHPMLRPDLDESDLKTYNDICKTLGIKSDLADRQSYMQFMNYNQICYLEFHILPKIVFQVNTNT